MEFAILGLLEVRHGGRLVDVGGPRHRALLAVLLMHANRPLSAAALIEALWGAEPPKSAAAMVYVRVCELRKALGDVRSDGCGLVTRDAGYLFQVDPDNVDASRFERLADAGRRSLDGGDFAAASLRLRRALALWRGPALADISDRSFARPEIARLEERRLRALEDRVDADLALGRHGDIVAELRASMAEHPLRERLCDRLMRALYGDGRQAEALATYQDVRQLLRDQLGVDPSPELRQLYADILRHDPALDRPTTVPSRTAAGDPPHNLPTPLATFIGRQRELAEIRTLLREHRLVTVTGVGGAGKSRLAVEAATAQVPEHPDGTWLVELASLTESGFVVNVVAAALGVRERADRSPLDLVVDHLRCAEALLVVDNCEHVVAGAAVVIQALLMACPGVRVLATSRERLGITGEVLRPLSGLAVPEPGASTASAVGPTDSARLLVARAVAVAPGFALSDHNAAAVALTCQRLDGLPLAIELAAARTNTFDILDIAARLDDRFRLLTGHSPSTPRRHQTLRAVVDWSYDLLSEAERGLFDRLAVFVGGFTLDAAETVGAAHPAAHGTARTAVGSAVGSGASSGEPVAAVLARLVDKSLVTIEATPTRRYRLLESVRAYGLEKLDETGAAGAVRDRHAAYVLRLAEPAGLAMRGTDQALWLRRLELEHGNIRAALGWSLERGDGGTALRLAGSLYQLWDVHGHYAEGRQWLARVLAAGDPAPAPARVKALLAATGLAVIQGDLQEARATGEEAAALSRQDSDAAGLAHALQYLGFVAIYAEELDQASAYLEESRHNARASGDSWLEGWSLVFLAAAALARSEHDRAARLADECVAVFRAVGDAEALAAALVIGATAAWLRDDRRYASLLLRESLLGYQDLAGLWGMSLGLFLAAQLAEGLGDPWRLTVLLAASEALREEIGAALLPFMKAWLQVSVNQARTALGVVDFDRAWKEGAALPTDAALAEGLRVLDAAEGHG